MLMQSHLDAIDILPVLPEEIPEGYIKGIRARGGFELEFKWSEGKLTSLTVLLSAGCPLKLRYDGKVFSASTKKAEVLIFDGDLKRTN